MSPPQHGGRRAWRWIKRGILGLLAILVAAVASVVIALHTDWGRNLVRGQVEAKLNDVFVGGATVGKLEGSPFGMLVLRDVVINGPDRRPAIRVKRLALKLGLLPLISKQARLAGVIAEDVEVMLARDERGELEISRLVRPGPSSGWAVAIPDIQIHRAHVALDNRTEWVNLDGLEITAGLHMAPDQPLRANAMLTGTWRERAAPIHVQLAAKLAEQLIEVPSASVQVGGVVLAVWGLRMTKQSPNPFLPLTLQPPTTLAGTISVIAPKAAVARLVPGVELPEDVAVTIEASAPSWRWTHLDITGKLGATPVSVLADADLDGQHVRGILTTGSLDATTLSGGKIVGTGSAMVVFDATAPAPGKLPVATAMIQAWGQIAGVPNTAVTASLRTTAEHATVTAAVRGEDLTASLDALVTRHGESITLERGTLIANTTDPSDATGGKAPVHGVLHANLSASGVLSPALDLAVAGRIDGKRLRVQDLSVATLALAVDARRLPSRPLGRAELQATGIVRQDLALQKLAITAANREDGKIQVSVRTRPKRDPWLIEADALVTPPGGDGTVTIELQRHRVRAGGGEDWIGSTGRVTIAPDRIELRELASASRDGKLAASGVFHREGRRRGDLSARLELKTFALANVDKRWRGRVDVHVDVARTSSRLAGTVDVKGTGIALRPDVQALDVDARIAAGPGKLVVDGTVSGGELGTAKLAVDLDAPADLANVAAWKTRGRSHIRTGRIALDGLDVARIAAVAGMQGAYAGKIDGELQLAATTIGGQVRLRGVMAPALQTVGAVNADLDLSQTAPGELTPTLTARIDGLGRATAQATLGMPDRMFDPLAWRQLGRHALKHASVRVDDIAFDPALLDRFGIMTNLRGRAGMTAEIAEAARDAKLEVHVRELRGNPIVQPIDIEVTAAIDDTATTTTMTISSKTTTLLEVKGGLPVTIAALEANPRGVLDLPLQLTATLPNVSAPKLLAVFGRTEIIAGSLNGTVEVAGTAGKPTARVRLTGQGLAVPPGPRGKPIKTIERITLDARWDGTAGTLALDAAQGDGMLRLSAAADPKALDRATVTLEAKKFDLVPLLAFAPGPAGAGAGRLDAKMKLAGLDPRTAKLTGELHLAGGRVPVAPTIGTLRAAQIDLIVGEHDLRLAIDGKLGAGTVKASGTVAIDGASATGGDVTMTLRKVSPIGVVEPVIDANVHIKLRRDPGRWYADVDVRNATVKVPSGRGEKLKEPGAPPDMVFMTGERMTDRPMKREVPQRPVIAAHVVLHSTYVESDELRGLIKGALDLTADGESVGITGSIEADRGDLDLFGHRYQVERAAVRFDGTTDPLLDLQISHDFPDVTTITMVRGRVSKPELIMTSSPATYSQGQLLGFLLGGEPGGEPSTGSPRDKLTSAGASLVANKISGYVKDALPIDIDVLRYESATASSSAAVMIGTWLTRELFVAYRRRIEARPDENAGEGQIDYWISRRVMVEGTVGDRHYDGVDLLWRRRY